MWLDYKTLLKWYLKLSNDWWLQFKLELEQKATEMQIRILKRKDKKLREILEFLEESNRLISNTYLLAGW